MEILYLLTGGRDEHCSRLIDAHMREHEVTVIDLSKRDVPYDRIVDAIWAHEKVISW